DLHHVVVVQPNIVHHDLDVRIRLGDGFLGRLGLGFSDVGLAMDDLALQIGLVNCVEIDDAERSDASRGEIKQRRTAQAPSSDDQYACILQPLLAVHPYIRDDQMTAVTAYLVDAELIGGLYQRRQDHGSPPVQGRGAVPRGTGSLDLESNAALATAIPDDGMGTWHL